MCSTMNMKACSCMLPYLFFLAILFAWPVTSATLRAHLSHVDDSRGFTKRELLRRMVVRSRARAANLCPYSGATARPATAPVGRANTDVNSEYLIHLSIGAPRSQPVVLTLDTGSDVVWTQCEPCAECFTQPLPRFDTAASNTVRSVACSDPLCNAHSEHGCFLHGCTYVSGYGDGSLSFGHFLRDSFTFDDGKGGGKVTVPDIGFGCGMYNAGRFLQTETGIAGFGRGPLSLPSQLKVRQFSYCFTTRFEAKSSPVFLGGAGDLKAHATGPILSTPFVRSLPPGTDNSHYVLSFKGVTVGKTRLPVPEIKADGSGATFIDSGTDITTFPDAVFRQLKSAFIAQAALPVNKTADEDDICFSWDGKKTAAMPKLVFHLEGADWDLPRENYVTEDRESGQVCVAVSTSGQMDRTLIGNFQQQNTHIVYDLAAGKLLLVPVQCDKL
ncbi:aspartic proteinase nepenthesin-1-like [Hordeum vulgare subsp. vulgare]|uniref:Peptidase A1 domain-containing protein n=1 Tax=Hordeum vulgare subsp. vulgare TaxID=112509 RepID=A0A8I6WQF8_HORVV|nr:aspartic proteinase nepenthesin-1-like [Hordeum vulgare subsp. vulgare]